MRTLAAVQPRRDADLTAVGGELDGVGQEVEDHLLDLALVGLDDVDGRIHVQAEGDAVAAGALPDHGQAVFQSLGEREASKL